MLTRAGLLQSTCCHREHAATDAELREALGVLADWVVEDARLTRTFRFHDYHQTIAFVNAIAAVIHREDHHPELVVGYNRCMIRYDTHSVNGGNGGLSGNDFICAAKIDAIFQQGSWQNSSV